MNDKLDMQNNMDFVKEKSYKCQCMAHEVEVSKFTDDPSDQGIYLSFWYLGQRNRNTFWDKLKDIWGIFRHGKAWYESIVLSPENAKDLGKKLIEFSNGGAEQNG